MLTGKEMAKLIVSTLLASASILSFIIGVGDGSKNKCTYHSIAANINIPYRIGCELTKPRFK